MSSRRSWSALLLVLMGLTFVSNSGAFPEDIMEARNLATAREMLEDGNWLSPTMNGEPRLEKPPLPTWAAAAVMSAVGPDRLALLRLPAAAAAALLVLFLLALTRELTDDETTPFLAAATAATSFYVVVMARNITWDIFCHAFMLGAVWQLHRGMARDRMRLLPFVLAGLLMGLSFLSKGPVAFYALLLPYLIARAASSGAAPFKAHARPLLLAALVAIVISAAWPLHVYLAHPELSAEVARKESSAWLGRNVRPFFHYWSFPVQSGVWAVLGAAALVFPYARRRLGRSGVHGLLAGWVWAGVLLLSIFPEKKERYLLPVLLPLAMLTAFYVRSLVDAYRDGTATRADTFVLRLDASVKALGSFALPVVMWWVIRRNGFTPDPLLTIAGALVFWSLGLVLARAAWRKEPVVVWGATVALAAAVCVLAAGQLPKIATTNRGFRPYQELRHRADLAGMPFFRSAGVRGKFIEVVWASGREIGFWDPRLEPTPPVDPPLVLLSPEAPAEVLGPELCQRYEVEELGVFDGDQRGRGAGALRNHVTVIRPRVR